MKLYIIGDSWATTPDQEFLDDPNTPVPWQFLLYEKETSIPLGRSLQAGASIDLLPTGRRCQSRKANRLVRPLAETNLAEGIYWPLTARFQIQEKNRKNA